MNNQFSGFKTDIPVRIYDINYGRHVGHAELLRIIHEARLVFFANYSLQEDNIDGVGIIVKNSSIDFKNEAFFNDLLQIYITIVNIKRSSFEMTYEVTKNNNAIHVATVKETSLFINYETRKIAAVPQVIFTLRSDQ